MPKSISSLYRIFVFRCKVSINKVVNKTIFAFLSLKNGKKHVSSCFYI